VRPIARPVLAACRLCAGLTGRRPFCNSVLPALQAGLSHRGPSALIHLRTDPPVRTSGLKGRNVIARPGGPGRSPDKPIKPCKGATIMSQSLANIVVLAFVLSRPYRATAGLCGRIPGPSARAITLRAFSPQQSSPCREKLRTRYANKFRGTKQTSLHLLRIPPDEPRSGISRTVRQSKFATAFRGARNPCPSGFIRGNKCKTHSLKWTANSS